MIVFLKTWQLICGPLWDLCNNMYVCFIQFHAQCEITGVLDVVHPNRRERHSLMPVCYSVGWQLKSWIRGVAFFRPTDCAGQMILALAYPIPQFLNHYRKVSLIVTQMIARLFWNKIIPLGVTRWHCGDDDIVSRAHQCADVRRTTRAVARQESRFSSAPWGISMHSTWWNHFGSRRQIMAQSDIQSLPIELRLTLAAVLCGDYWALVSVTLRIPHESFHYLAFVRDWLFLAPWWPT